MKIPRILKLTVYFGAASAAVAEPAKPILERDVLPILTKQCMGCHGGLKQKGGLDLRTLESIRAGGESGTALVPGNLEKSEMWLQIDEGEMPKGDEKLSEAEKATIREWIAAGAPTYSESADGRERPFLPDRKKHDPRQVAEAIDQHVAKGLEIFHLAPTPLADDAEFMRRVYLDITGRVPTPEQAVAFLDDGKEDKRANLVDTLLASAEFGEQFGRTWRDWVCPPELPSDMNGGKQPIRESQELGTWFSKRFAAGEPWDKTVRDLLCVQGEIKTNPEMIFFGLVGQNAKATPDGSARSVASLFMGVQIACAQCHDDPYKDWAQNDFWAMAAFFGNVQGDFKKISEQSGEGRITIPDSAFKNSGTKVPVAFLGENKELAADQKSTWRPAFADWLTAKENPYFARSFANRLWFYFFARGIVNPVDDMRELNPPSHPGLLALLGNEFADSGFDVKHLVRCICLSDTYQRTSLPGPKNDRNSVALTNENFGRMPLRVMTADMLYDSLKLAYGDPKFDLRAIDPKDGNQNGESAPVGDPLLQFQRDFCTNEEDATDFTHGIPQMLTLINHPRLSEGSKALDDFLKSDPQPTPQQTVERLYLSTLSRRPTNEEMAEAVSYSARVKEESSNPFSDILWMLVNRSEFSVIR